MQKKKITKKQLKRLYIKFGWIILECKILYYYPSYSESSKVKCLSDEQYDKIEDKYKKISKALKLKAHACERVGADLESPSARLAIEGNFPMLRKHYQKRKA